MKVFVGLGNPGSEYANTRHNVGFSAVQRLARRWKVAWKDNLRCRAKVGEGRFGKIPVRLVQPQTFMNSSGEAIACLARSWRLGPEAFLVVCDDFALPLGSLRLRGQGSDGGHQGLASILSRMQTQEIARLRVGIAGERIEGDWTPFVLGKFTEPEEKKLEAALEQAVDACECWAAVGTAGAMNRFNRRKRETS
ncbi:MAG: aminoacyl-tRNA hydrolase [Candidatus Omnitrophica bacterium]|nr:aminoacyl-tRNA hydrolase [Candidatus Omnitrophota bacterium]